MKKRDFKLIFVLITKCISSLTILLLNTLTNTFAQVEVDFMQRTSIYTPTKKIYTIKGDFAMIGNTNLTLKIYDDYSLNSDNEMEYVDVDADPTTHNSSSATLTFSAENGAIPSCSNIIYAGLYWTARGDAGLTTAQKQSIKIKGPGETSYSNFIANASDIHYPIPGSSHGMYVAYTEVTDYVRNHGLGEYWAADMAMTEGNGGSVGYYGGWSIIVVYENSKMKWRDVTIFDGYAFISGGITDQYYLPVSGFNTAQSGTIGIKLGLMAGEGDRGVIGDYFEIIDQNNNYVRLNHGANDQNNFFNSSIFTGGNSRNPSLLNNTGLDISMFSIDNTNNQIIDNNQTSTTFRYGTTGDTYIIYCIAMAIDAFIPDVEGFIGVKTINGVPVSDPIPPVLPGDEVELKLEIRNNGSEEIDNLIVEIPIPSFATYVSSSTNIYFNPGPIPDNLSFDVSQGANGTIIWDFGTLPYYPSNPDSLLARLTYVIKITEDCELLNNPNCIPSVYNAGKISGIGAVHGVIVSDKGFIQGHQVNAPCIGEPISVPIIIDIDATDYITNNCPPKTWVKEFISCYFEDVMDAYRPGTRFYNEWPVTATSIEYDINNPFPGTVGTNTYYADPPGEDNCFWELKITVPDINLVTTASKIQFYRGESVNISVSGHSAGSSLLWNTGDTDSIITVNPERTTKYKVQVTTELGCVFTDSITIFVDDWSVNLGEDLYLCDNQPIILFVDSIPVAKYRWNTGDTTASIMAVENGTYILTVTIGNISQSDAVEIEFTDMDFEVPPIKGCITFVDVLATGGRPPYQYSIDGQNYQPEPRFLNIESKKYTFYVKDNGGCIKDTVAMIESPNIPNYFSPNDDDINDTWEIKGLENCTNTKIIIFDRYGRTLHTMSVTDIWDGMYLNEALPTDTYWYAIEFNDGINKTLKGNVTIKRR